ncbi:GNAT family N-acetyltransferase [Halobacillus amylolyticus]|uniref:GNAT family N-acetyltransferase n=1 Tax=Halobacillus amylolyticus TaxID=2932259 RepID=A0ABY4HHV5_9BACI|nr:GNAT family N-acetyltransferase [Halobacillus amylolyticus]UOR14161.1 GNAT family N-acetyltransferase [Halobacillus amylolyticus]
MIIRDVLESELEYIKNLRLDAYNEHEQKVPRDHWNVLKQQILTEEDLQSNVDQLVAEVEGEIVGTVVLFPPKTELYTGLLDDELDYPEIRKLAVSSKFRGKGVAKAMISECIRRTKNRGFRSIGLHTADFMENAVKLYEGLGFERLPQYDFEPADDGIIVKAFRIHIK